MRTRAHSPDRGGSGGWNLMLTCNFRHSWIKKSNTTDNRRFATRGEQKSKIPPQTLRYLPRVAVFSSCAAGFRVTIRLTQTHCRVCSESSQPQCFVSYEDFDKYFDQLSQYY